jgi:hypothetical protein
MRQARKPHQCVECGEQISVGDSYEESAGVSEGEWWVQRTCI